MQDLQDAQDSLESKISEGKKEVYTDLKKEIELKDEAQTKERDES